MIEVIGVRFREAGKVYYFSPGEETFPRYSHVIVETARGLEYGTVVLGNKEVEEETVVQPLKPVVRLASEEDEERHRSNLLKEREAMAVCQEKILARGLDMKLIDTEFTFDNNKILFYFTADGRVDFRELVKDLASVFKTRIELRQIGVRDETKILGGVGICGRPLCCHTYLADFAPVSIKMAKEQNLSLNPTKISGTCGRLMCCLKNEQETYEYLNSHMPAIGEKVTGPEGVHGEVASVNVLRQTVKVLVNVEKDEKELKEYAASELKFRPRRRKGEKNAETSEEATVQTQEIVEITEGVEEISVQDGLLHEKELLEEESLLGESTVESSPKGKREFKDKSPRYEKNRRGSKPSQKDDAEGAEGTPVEGVTQKRQEKKGKGPRADAQGRPERSKAGQGEGEEPAKYRKKSRPQNQDGQGERHPGKNARNERFGKGEGAEGYQKPGKPDGFEEKPRAGKAEGSDERNRSGRPEGGEGSGRPGKNAKNYPNRKAYGAGQDGQSGSRENRGSGQESQAGTRENRGVDQNGQGSSRVNQSVGQESQGGGRDDSQGNRENQNGGRENAQGSREGQNGGKNYRKNYNNYNNRRKNRDQTQAPGQNAAVTGAPASSPRGAEHGAE